MNLLQLIERGLKQRKLSSLLTATSVALGVMLVCAILVVQREIDRTYSKQAEGYSLVVGPAGSELEIVLSSIYHVDQASGLLPWALQEEFEGKRWEGDLRLAVPYALGDSFYGYRVVATTEGLFSHVFPQPRAEKGREQDKFAAGGPFRCEPKALREALDLVRAGGAKHEHDHDHDHGHVREAVVGAEVADRLGLELGSKIEPTHGVEGDHAHHHHEFWKVVGIFERTGTAVDRVVFINLDSFYRIAEHAGGRTQLGDAGISSILLFPRGGYRKAAALNKLMKRSDFTVAEVGTEIAKLKAIVGNVDRIFLVVAILVVVIGIISVMVAIYNTMNERRREIAILRSLGARRRTILALVVGEAGAISVTGGLLGILLGHLLLYAVKDYVLDVSGLALDPWRILGNELLVLCAVAVLGAISGLIPAWKAYRTDVAAHLAPLS